MQQQILSTIYLSGAFLALFAFAELLFLKFKVQGEVTRKIVHIGTGLLVMLFPLLLDNLWLVLLLCSSFAVILTLSMKFKFLKGINSIDRKSHGSISYPVAVFLTYLFYDLHETHELILFYLPVLTMAIADPAAAFAGKKTNFIPISIFGERKTMGGFIGFFMTSLALSLTLNYFFQPIIPLGLGVILVIACIGALTEILTPRGLDNITIPLFIALTLFILH